MKTYINCTALRAITKISCLENTYTIIWYTNGQTGKTAMYLGGIRK